MNNVIFQVENTPRHELTAGFLILANAAAALFVDSAAAVDTLRSLIEAIK